LIQESAVDEIGVRPEMVVLPWRDWFRAKLERFCNPAYGGTECGYFKDCEKAKTPPWTKKCLCRTDTIEEVYHASSG